MYYVLWIWMLSALFLFIRPCNFTKFLIFNANILLLADASSRQWRQFWRLVKEAYVTSWNLWSMRKISCQCLLIKLALRIELAIILRTLKVLLDQWRDAIIGEKIYFSFINFSYFLRYFNVYCISKLILTMRLNIYKYVIYLKFDPV